MWFYDIIQASRRWREVALSFSCWLVSYRTLATLCAGSCAGDKKRYVTPYDSGIDTSDTPQHRNRSATRDASRRAAAYPLRHAQLHRSSSPQQRKSDARRALGP